MADALSDVVRAIDAHTKQRKTEFDWFKSHLALATKQDLKDMEKRIMATQAEILADLKAAIVSLKQVNEDTKDAQASIDELKAKIVELEALIQAGGAITPEIAEAVAEVKALAQSADDNLPNRVVVPTV